MELAQAQFESPNDPPPGASWSDCFRALAEACAGRDGLVEVGLLASRAEADDLNRAGRRTEAVEVLGEAIGRAPDNAYAVALRVDLGTYLRAQHEFGRALDELRSAASAIADQRARAARADLAAYLDSLEVTATSELGAVCGALGMTDRAVQHFDRADGLAVGLDDVVGPTLWGANLVYRLNTSVSRGRQREVEPLRALFESHPWRSRLPEETRKQIEMRLAVARTGAAFRGEAEDGAGEAELRALIDSGLKFEEDLRARIYLAQSLLDRNALEEARACLDDTAEKLEGQIAIEPRLHDLGLRARLLRELGAPVEERRRLLVDRLRPAMEGFLTRAAAGPIEEAGVSVLFYDWARATWSELIELEIAVDEGGRGVERAVEWLLRLQGVGTFARERGIDSPTLSEVRRELLVPGRGLLLYVPGRTRSHVFALTGSELHAMRLGPVHRLDHRARELERSIQAAVGAPSEHALAVLDRELEAASEAFVPPELAAILAGASSIHAVGLDDFGYVPLEALRLPGGEPVGRTHEIVYQPSLPVAVWLARASRADGKPTGPVVFYLGSGDPAAGSRPALAPLRLDPSALGLGAFGTAGVAADALGTGELDALPSRLAGAAIGGFVLHGVYDPSRVRPAGLLVAPEEADGVWFAETIEGLSTPAFALVAACGTDRAPLRRGDDGRGHLRAAFFRGGSRCVAAATVTLELRATGELTSIVSERLAAGDSVGQAFLAARRRARPGDHGLPAVHSYLIHVFGYADLRPTRRDPATGPAASGEGARDPFAWTGPALGVALAVLIAGGLWIRSRRSRAAG